MINQIRGLIKYRHLLWDLAIKDIKVRYRSPALGFLWAVIMPLVMVLIFKFVFSTIMKSEIEKYPFFVYLMTAVFPWTYFSSSVGAASESIVNNHNLIKKTYFPREIIPVSVVLANLINFIPALVVMLLMLAFFRTQFTILLFLLPFVIFLQTIFTIGLALIVSSLQVILRDVKYMVELLLMAWLYFSPAFYSLATVANFSEGLLRLYIFNPFVGLFTLYRIVFLKGYAQTLPHSIDIRFLLIWTIAACIGTFLLGLSVFKKYEQTFSDLI